MEIILANPRGFCAGVTRAIQAVEKALQLYGKPVYVRHEIVHNKFVVESLKAKGAIFVQEIAEIPHGATTIFSAHGVSDLVEEQAKHRNLDVIDATCPLVSKVHREAKKYVEEDFELILIGHKGHPEVEGTKGKVGKEVILVSDEEDAKTVQLKNPQKIAYVTQTTLSVDDTKKIVEILEQRFPQLQKGLATKDICYATQNRQDAVRQLANMVEVLIVLGAKNSSNSNRLRDLGQECGLPSYLINSAGDIESAWFSGITKIGITAGASAPEVLVQEVLAKIQNIANNSLTVSEMEGIKENVFFALPKKVRKANDQ
ncbi:MAG: 4-hydroxy-3-methylbut-2-enyl diphosphate reductase [Proteobacteria bacterium]|jgi:4-hydroxy-3-methylbut-2-enyl diphosphate reductase|nr:4-hydroxy-3-methylbut-2-enyl diphosphate reductase [Pseudomonadota bacterium]